MKPAVVAMPDLCLLQQLFYQKIFIILTLNDSKQLTAEKRNELKVIIKANAIAYAVAMVDNEEIDQINILRASFKAMHLALDKLKKRPSFLLIDGNRFIAYKKLKHECIIKGDGIYASIAAASILAKTHRDAYMKQLHKEFPQYNWKQNKGYGTEEHRNAIEIHGLCKYHRKSFDIAPGQISIFPHSQHPRKYLKQSFACRSWRYIAAYGLSG